MDSSKVLRRPRVLKAFATRGMVMVAGGVGATSAVNPTHTAGQHTNTAIASEPSPAREAQTEFPTATESQPSDTTEQTTGPPTVNLEAAGNYQILSKSSLLNPETTWGWLSYEPLYLVTESISYD